MNRAAVPGDPLAPVRVVHRHDAPWVRIQIDAVAVDDERPRLDVVRVGRQRPGRDELHEAVGVLLAVPQFVRFTLSLVPHAVHAPSDTDAGRSGDHECATADPGRLQHRSAGDPALLSLRRLRIDI